MAEFYPRPPGRRLEWAPQIRHTPHRRTHHGQDDRTHRRRRAQARGLPRGSSRQSARRHRRDPGDLRREQPHPVGRRRLCRRRLHGHCAGQVRPRAARLRHGLLAARDPGRRGGHAEAGLEADPARRRRGSGGGQVRRQGGRGRLLLGRHGRLGRGCAHGRHRLHSALLRRWHRQLRRRRAQGSRDGQLRRAGPVADAR